MPFNPNDHLRNLKGSSYLDVKWRLVWLAEDCPRYRITTELLRYIEDGRMWVFKARVEIFDENGQLVKSAEGTGQETEKDFPSGPCEKAETKAIGRALAAAGFGTQFAVELDEGDKVVDSPVPTKAKQSTNTAPDPRAPLPTQDAPQLKSVVTGLLAKDAEAKAKLPKDIEAMSSDELAKTEAWLRKRARDNQQ